MAGADDGEVRAFGGLPQDAGGAAVGKTGGDGQCGVVKSEFAGGVVQDGLADLVELGELSRRVGVVAAVAGTG